MATKKVYQGSVGPFLFDDTNTFSDGKSHKGLISETGIEVNTTQDPSGDELVTESYLSKVIRRVTVTSINDPSAELNALDPEEGSVVICSQTSGGNNLQAIYIGDAASNIGESIPDTVDGVGSTKWIKFNPTTPPEPTMYSFTGHYKWSTATPDWPKHAVFNYATLDGGYASLSTTSNDVIQQTGWNASTQSFSGYLKLHNLNFTGPYFGWEDKAFTLDSVDVQAGHQWGTPAITSGDPKIQLLLFKVNETNINHGAGDYDIVDLFTQTGTATTYWNYSGTINGSSFTNTQSIAAKEKWWGIFIFRENNLDVGTTGKTFEPRFSVKFNYKET